MPFSLSNKSMKKVSDCPNSSGGIGAVTEYARRYVNSAPTGSENSISFHVTEEGSSEIPPGVMGAHSTPERSSVAMVVVADGALPCSVKVIESKNDPLNNSSAVAKPKSKCTYAFGPFTASKMRESVIGVELPPV